MCYACPISPYWTKTTEVIVTNDARDIFLRTWRAALGHGAAMMMEMAVRLARLFEPETAHGMVLAGLNAMPSAKLRRADKRLAVTVAGLDFAHPVLLAAGFDKDGVGAHAMGRFGFAGVEVGTLTPLAQAGNPRPRLFRLTDDAAVINRMGFNNGGQAAALPRLARQHARTDRPLLGRIADYVTGVRAMAPVADWLTANISSPNTPGLRALQDEGALDALLAAMAAARVPPNVGHSPPLFLKVAPDLDREQIGGIVRAVVTHGIDAIIIGNTTISRPPLRSADTGETGGLSGTPLGALALERLRDFRSATGGAVPLIAAGGIASAADIRARLAAGASLVQLYSALVFHGPGLAARIVDDLTAMLDQEDVRSINDWIDYDFRPAS
jgi:dihydroorotate dehydrogenase